MTKRHPEDLEPLVLEHCRFCRSSGVNIEIAQPRGFANGESFVFCRQCKASGPSAASVEIAVEAWNCGVTIRRKDEAKP